MERDDARVRVVVRVHEVGAVAAVHMHVDEAGHEDAVDAFGIRGHVRGLCHVRDHLFVDRHEHSVANRAVDERAAVQMSHSEIFPSTVGMPPVAPATLVIRPTTASFAIMAMAMASFASLAL